MAEESTKLIKGDQCQRINKISKAKKTNTNNIEFIKPTTAVTINRTISEKQLKMLPTLNGYSKKSLKRRRLNYRSRPQIKPRNGQNLEKKHLSQSPNNVVILKRDKNLEKQLDAYASKPSLIYSMKKDNNLNGEYVSDTESNIKSADEALLVGSSQRRKSRYSSKKKFVINRNGSVSTVTIRGGKETLSLNRGQEGGMAARRAAKKSRSGRRNMKKNYAVKNVVGARKSRNKAREQMREKFKTGRKAPESRRYALEQTPTNNRKGDSSEGGAVDSGANGIKEQSRELRDRNSKPKHPSDSYFFKLKNLRKQRNNQNMRLQRQQEMLERQARSPGGFGSLGNLHNQILRDKTKSRLRAGKVFVKRGNNDKEMHRSVDNRSHKSRPQQPKLYSRNTMPPKQESRTQRLAGEKDPSSSEVKEFLRNYSEKRKLESQSSNNVKKVKTNGSRQDDAISNNSSSKIKINFEKLGLHDDDGDNQTEENSQTIMDPVSPKAAQKMNRATIGGTRQNQRMKTEERKNAAQSGNQSLMSPKESIINLRKEIQARRESNVVGKKCFLGIGRRSIGGQKQGKAKTNQDSCFYQESVLGYSDLAILAVFDGHGFYGHRVSKFLTSNLLSKP